MKRCPSYMHVLTLAILFIASSIVMNAQGLVDATDVPRTISYQGLLTSSDGTPFTDGQYEITVSLYADGRGDNSVWQDSYIADVNGGVFNVLIGSGSKALPSSDKLSTPLWIGTSVNGAPEMRPLTPMTASPYALNVPDQAITSNKIAANAVTADKVDMDYIAGLEIDGQQVVGKGSMLKLKSSDKISLTYDEVSQTVMIDEAAHATGTTGDGDKGASLLGTPDQVWSTAGDGWDHTANAPYVVVAGDLLGPLTAGVNFNLTTGTGLITIYQPSAGAGLADNIVSGNANTIAAGADGSVIGGGGGPASPNNITGSGVKDVIAGGMNNDINEADWNFVGGGDNNDINDGDYNVMGGGQNNIVSNAANPSHYNVLGGGLANQVFGSINVVGGGTNNVIGGGTGSSTISGGSNNAIAAPMATIGGGDGHTVTGPEGTIAGGHINTVSAYVGTIGGGHDNVVGPTGDAGFIGGGRANLADAMSSTIGGGNNNQINQSSDLSFIGGGENNTIPTASMHATIGGGSNNILNNGSDGSFIGGGTNNQITGVISTIGGGDNHNINAAEAVIAGGHVNTVNAYAGSIVGGHDNVVANGSDFGIVGGGQGNTLNSSGSFGTIGGGQNNIINGGSDGSFIGGGTNNQITGPISTIGGGDGHNINAPEAVIAGGHINTVESYAGSIVGGHDNVVGPGSDFGFIGGGQGNVLDNGMQSTIGGGPMNLIQAPMATIGGGANNTITAGGAEGTIAGGHVNTVESYVAAIGGGHDNIATVNGTASFIGGGRANIADADLTAIGGGQDNNTIGSHTTIVGGDFNLTDPSYAQTIAGFFNAPRGAAVGVRPTAAVVAATDLPLFMVGNGDINAAIPVRSNAFEVSYNGHSTVFDQNGQGSAGLMRPAHRGARYDDNTIYGWGCIDAAGGIVDDFGVATVAHVPGSGVYVITLNFLDPYTGAATFAGSICPVATIGDGNCGFISVTCPPGPGVNAFTVTTMNPTCGPEDLPFTFHVTARP